MAQKEIVINEKKQRNVDFEKVQSSPDFKQFLSKKRKFLVPMTIFFMIFYFTLPILTSYTTFLNNPAIGDISWVWLFAFSQFIMVWVLSGIYVKKASAFDKEAEEIIKEHLN